MLDMYVYKVYHKPIKTNNAQTQRQNVLMYTLIAFLQAATGKPLVNMVYFLYGIGRSEERRNDKDKYRLSASG